MQSARLVPQYVGAWREDPVVHQANASLVWHLVQPTPMHFGVWQNALVGHRAVNLVSFLLFMLLVLFPDDMPSYSCSSIKTRYEMVKYPSPRA